MVDFFVADSWAGLGVPDMTSLAHIDETIINQNLHTRYNRDHIYVSFLNSIRGHYFRVYVKCVGKHSRSLIGGDASYLAQCLYTPDVNACCSRHWRALEWIVLSQYFVFIWMRTFYPLFSLELLSLLQGPGLHFSFILSFFHSELNSAWYSWSIL